MAKRLISPRKIDKCVGIMRDYFHKRGFVEVFTQSQLSILAACEDPSTIATYQYEGQVWPLPQTGQMWLEHALLDDPTLPGVFCSSTSYRNEPNPIPGRHDKIFPMFEFESHGDITNLKDTLNGLLEYMNFPKTGSDYPSGDYREIADKYNTQEIEHEHEAKIEEDYGPVFLLENFPFETSPFWNMKANFKTGDSNKIDVILHGVETIGSAERSTNREEMKKMFETISDGQYRTILDREFTRDRVNEEMDDFLSHEFTPRYGGGIGVTRMIKAMEQSKLL